MCCDRLHWLRSLWKQTLAMNDGNNTMKSATSKRKAFCVYCIDDRTTCTHTVKKRTHITLSVRQPSSGFNIKCQLQHSLFIVNVMFTNRWWCARASWSDGVRRYSAHHKQWIIRRSLISTIPIERLYVWQQKLKKHKRQTIRNRFIFL